jgi:hypothetical protein
MGVALISPYIPRILFDLNKQAVEGEGESVVAGAGDGCGGSKGAASCSLLLSVALEVF